jgi:N-acetylmuramoyl-L-alanine amidase
MPDYVVQEGDCFALIACRHGFLPQTLWDHPANAALKQQRGNPGILMPGDVVCLPPPTPRQETGGTEQRHLFRRKNSLAKLELKLLRAGQPVANEPFLLDIDGCHYRGRTGPDGLFVQAIPACARRGLLTFGKAPYEEQIVLDIGTLDPASEMSGVQARLNNLGFDSGTEDGNLGPRTEAALGALQETHGLRPTKAPDSATRGKIVDLHGS